MLQIKIPAIELWDEEKQMFINEAECILNLEHSLVSISKWEAKWHKVFLSKSDKTEEETLDYIKCMTLSKNVDPEIYSRLSRENISQINDYINDSRTATYFSEDKKQGTSREPMTSELIYYWMVTLNIPFECQKWHLNRLITLIKVCDRKNSPPKKMGERKLMSRNAALNAARRKKFNTKG